MSAEWPNIKLEARKIVETHAEMAAKLHELINERHAIVMNKSEKDARRRHISETKCAIEINIIKRKLAMIFGAIYGWRLTDRPFTASVLARRGVWDGHTGCAFDTWPPQFVDHPYFYRLGNRASGLACHDYNTTESSRIATRAWAERSGLTVSFPENFPSWWYPESTTLVVFTPGDAGGEHGGR